MSGSSSSSGAVNTKAVASVPTSTLLVFRRKDLCEARVNFEVSSNFQMKYPDKLSDIPSCMKLSVTGDEVFADLCHH